MKASNTNPTTWLARLHGRVPIWSIALPAFACTLLVILHGLSLAPVLAFISLITLLGVVLVAVYHAEVIAHRIGEPFGALVLALAVTVIEVSLIVSMMLSDAGDASSLTRDTVFATIMIVCNGVIGLCLLLLSLIGVVGLAETMAPLVEATVVSFSLPHAVVGVAIALMVLLPETMAAVRTSMRNQMQIGFNLALGSALASIGLTIPTIAAISLYLELPMDLGLPPTEMVLLVLTLFLTAITLTGGKATILHGAVHLVVFACFLFLSVIP